MPVQIFFADEQLRASYEKLKQGDADEKELAAFLGRAFDDIEKNPTCGIQIPQRLIPKEYKAKHSVSNLWKYNLPNAWRLLYTLKGDRIEVVAIILEWFDHKNYERRFGYG